jgi:acetyl esterase
MRSHLHEQKRRFDAIVRRFRHRSNRLFTEGILRGVSGTVRLLPLAQPARHKVELLRNIEYGREDGLSLRLDVYRPLERSQPLPIVLYMHGGAFSILSKDTHWMMALGFARHGYLVFNIDYRLAPEHPYPAAVSDACTALEWVSQHAESYGGDLSRVVFAGESAGGNLATALTVCCCYRRPEPFAQRAFETGIVPSAVIPACAPLQVTDPARLSRRRKLPFFANDVLRGMRDSYLRNVRDAAPSEKDLADPLYVFERGARPARPLPPFFIPVGTKDPLLDDTRRLERALKAMGVPCKARYYPGEIHAFHALVWRRGAKRCWKDQLDFLDEVVETRPRQASA